MQSDNVTLIQLLHVFKGTSIARIVQCGYDKLPLFGCGKKYTKHDAERLGINTVYLCNSINVSVGIFILHLMFENNLHTSDLHLIWLLIDSI